MKTPLDFVKSQILTIILCYVVNRFCDGSKIEFLVFYLAANVLFYLPLKKFDFTKDRRRLRECILKNVLLFVTIEISCSSKISRSLCLPLFLRIKVPMSKKFTYKNFNLELFYVPSYRLFLNTLFKKILILVHRWLYYFLIFFFDDVSTDYCTLKALNVCVSVYICTN